MGVRGLAAPLAERVGKAADLRSRATVEATNSVSVCATSDVKGAWA